MTGWRLQQLTFGSDTGLVHAHSYYDIPVFNAAEDRIVALRHRHVPDRHPSPADAVEIGLVEIGRAGSWQGIGRSTAWSWQQGPMAQWVPAAGGAGERLIWNDRQDERFVARLVDPAGKVSSVTLPMPVYAVMPGGTAGLSVDMARLDMMRPGYGYAREGRSGTFDRIPRNNGLWLVPFDGTAPRLILPLGRAVDVLRRHLGPVERLRHRMRRYHYWFNHVKIAPGGARFTLKLRWRQPGQGWSGRMGVSLTCDIATGRDLRFLGRATSHVIWLDDTRLYYFDEVARQVPLMRDSVPRGTRIGTIGGGLDANVHLRHLPPGPPEDSDLPQRIVYDTPYTETPELWISKPNGGDRQRIAKFTNHLPPKGPFRCDLHPVPDAGGKRLVVTSPQDGGRQIYLLERT